MANTDEIIGIIDEVFKQDEDIINDLPETNDIEQPEDDKTIPDADEDSGESSDPTPETTEAGDKVDPDPEDIIDENETQDITESPIAVEESEATPIIDNKSELPTIGNIQQGDRVMIALINGQPTVLGTVGSGDRQQEEINVISADVAVLGTVVAGKANITDLDATNAKVQNLETTKANVTELNAATGRITNLEANKANVSDLNATNAQIDTLKTTKAAITDLQATNAIVANLQTEKASVSDLDAANAKITDLQTNKASVQALAATNANVEALQTDKADVTDLNAANANIESLQTSKANVTDLNAAKGRITTLEGDYADLNTVVAGKVDTSNLTANYITANQIATDYAKVNAANINTATLRNAWVDKVMVQTGLLAHEGTIYTLDAIQLNADRISAGTIDVQRLIVTVDNHKYLVQFDAQGTPSYQKLDGDVIQDLTITADKIVAGAVTAQKITTENIVGTGGWINLRNGTFNYNNATSGEGISWDGTNLNINASTINIGSTNVMTTINGVKDAVDNIQIGGRNIVRNTAIMPTTKIDGYNFRASGGTVTHVDLDNPPINGISGAIRVTNSGSSVAQVGMAQDSLKNCFIAGEVYTMSCWVRASVNIDVVFQTIWASNERTTRSSGTILGYKFKAGTDWTYLKWEGATLLGTQVSQYSAGYVYGTNVPANGWFEVCGLKVEKGNKATAWTPAPEDIDNSITTVQTNTNAVNLSPYFSYSPYIKNDYWHYWQNTPAITFTEVGDGWVRIYCDNTSNSNIRRDFTPVLNKEIKEGAEYTWLIEFRNNNSYNASGSSTNTDFYMVQSQNNQFFGGTIKENLEGKGTTGNGTDIITYVPIVGTTVDGVEITKDYVYKKRFIKVSEKTGTSAWTDGNADNVVALACFTARCAKQTKIDYEVRISLYEGRYLGEYKPYVDQKARLVANTASSNASTALSTANTANTTANTANTNASTALTTANTANTTANNANTTANQAKAAVQNVQTLIRQYSDGVLVCKTNNTVGALVNADGSFDVSNVTWSGGTPSAGTSLATFGTTARIGSATGNNLFIDSDSIDIKDGSDVVASFGNTVMIGKEGQNSLTLDYHSLVLKDQNNNEYVNLSDLRDSTGYALVSDSFIGDGSTVQFTVNYTVTSVQSVTVDGAATTGYSRNGKVFTFTTAPNENEVILIKYQTTNAVRGYTFGSRKNGSFIGADSFVSGQSCTASGTYSHAEGFQTISSGFASHAEGLTARASASSSHAQGAANAIGIGSHAEGGILSEASGLYSHSQGYSKASGQASHSEGDAFTQAKGKYSHAQGSWSTASGECSHANGLGAKASKKAQTVIGRYNIEDSASGDFGKYAFIIGNGTGTPSNALTVDWNGTIETADGFTTSTNVTKLDNCDDGTDPRKYYYLDSSGTNKPSTAWIYLRCFAKSGQNVIQIATSMDALTSKMWMRSRNANGVWGDWELIPTISAAPYKWKSASYTASNLASGYTDVTTNVKFPNLTGYARTIMVVGTNSAYTGATGAYIDSNNNVHIRCRNFNSATSSPTISFILIYLNNSYTWT